MAGCNIDLLHHSYLCHLEKSHYSLRILLECCDSLKGSCVIGRQCHPPSGEDPALRWEMCPGISGGRQLDGVGASGLDMPPVEDFYTNSRNARKQFS